MKYHLNTKLNSNISVALYISVRTYFFPFLGMFEFSSRYWKRRENISWIIKEVCDRELLPWASALFHKALSRILPFSLWNCRQECEEGAKSGLLGSAMTQMMCYYCIDNNIVYLWLISCGRQLFPYTGSLSHLRILTLNSCR